MTITRQDEYRVTLDAFEGPMDLLLYLIRRVEVDITEIPIARIADQYLEFLHHVEDVDVETAGDFLVMAATLIELKSRSLMPPEEAEGEGGEGGEGDGEKRSGGAAVDPRLQFVRQLLAYQRYRTAAEWLDEQRLAFMAMHPNRPGRLLALAAEEMEASAASAGGSDEVDEGEDEFDADLELEDVHVLDLAEAYERCIGSVDLSRLGDHIVEMDDTPIALHQEDLMDRLRRSSGGKLLLQDAFKGQSVGQRVGMFLATLELTRTRKIRVQQDEIDSEIVIVLNPDADAESEDDGEGEAVAAAQASDASSAESA
jgi:segregation and condensation protein A